jgi:hypothetical protein
VDVGELTSAKAAPYLIAMSTDFSIDSLISGEYVSSNSSRSRSDERSASAYTNNISLRGWTVGEVRTSLFTENCNSRETLCFPTTIPTVFLNQVCGDWSVKTTLTQYGELVVIRAPVIIEKSLEVDYFARLLVLSPK